MLVSLEGRCELENLLEPGLFSRADCEGPDPELPSSHSDRKEIDDALELPLAFLLIALRTCSITHP